MLTHAFQDRINGATHIEMRVAKPKPKDQAFVNITKAIGNLRPENLPLFCRMI
jgi:hypothetical protein